MSEELQRLRESGDLFSVLTHYAERAVPDRQAWQDRLMTREGCDSRDLSRLHGELLAYGWLEQNSAVVVVSRPGEVPACYRVTRDGLRALRQMKEEDA